MSARLFRKPGSLIWWSRSVDSQGRISEHSTCHVDLDAAARAVADMGAPAASPARAARNQAPRPAAYDLNQALADFISHGELNRSAATLECYEQRGGHLVRLAGQTVLEAMHVDLVHGYCTSRLAEGAARESVRKELCVLRQTLQLARDRGLFAKDPEALIPRFRAKYTPRRRWLSEDEFERLLTQLAPERQVWLMVAVCTGGRLGELEILAWGDIEWAERRIHVRGTKTRTSDRFVPLHEPLAQVLQPLRRSDQELVVGRWKNVRRDLAQACARAGIERVSPNDLRRTFASWLKQAECDSLAVAKLLGHTTSRMVELVYGHLNQRVLAEAIERLPIAKGRAGLVRAKKPGLRKQVRRTLH